MDIVGQQNHEMEGLLSQLKNEMVRVILDIG